MSQYLISVITPFHNTAAYLAECIESVLAQSYSTFEYILVDNCSTDGSTEIAEHYARRDSRIRLIRHSKLLSQVQNYNSAISEVSSGSGYCKLVQADDFIFPECLRLMVGAFGHSGSVGLVSSYWLKGNEVRGSGFPFPTPVIAGKELARLYLRKGLWVFGSPTAVMYRSCLIKKGEPFYDPTQLHEDSDKCLQILQQWDFSFVHQVLSFSRFDNESISSAVRGFQPTALDRYILIKRYASAFLEADEANSVKSKTRQDYYSVLALEAIRGRETAFWQYHEKGLATIGETLSRSYMGWRIFRELVWKAANPAIAIGAASRLFLYKTGLRNSAR